MWIIGIVVIGWSIGISGIFLYLDGFYFGFFCWIVNFDGKILDYVLKLGGGFWYEIFVCVIVKNDIGNVRGN